MMKKNLIKGCAMVMLVCLTGCGRSSKPVQIERNIEPPIEQQTDKVSAKPPEEESQTEVKQSESVDLSELSDDLYSYQIIINDELYQLPMDFSELVSKGWELDGDENEGLDAYTYTPLRTFKNGDYELEASIVNLTDSPQPYSACQIVGISVDLFYNWQNDITFILPKGIQSGKSTPEDVKNAYGEPTRDNPGDETSSMTYEKDYARKEIRFTFRDGILKAVSISNEDY